MSTNYNLVGKTLTVDKIIEKKGSKIQSEADKAHYLANAVLLANYTNLKEQMAYLADDNYLSTKEKQQVARELITINSTYASLYTRTIEALFNDTSSIYYADYVALNLAYTTLTDYLTPLLANTNPEVIDGSLFTTNWTNYYNAVTPIEQDLFAAIYGLTDQINMTLSSEFFIYENNVSPIIGQVIAVFIIDKQKSSPCVLKVNGIVRSYTNYIAEITLNDITGLDEVILELSNDSQTITKTIRKIFNGATGDPGISVTIEYAKNTSTTIPPNSETVFIFGTNYMLFQGMPMGYPVWSRIAPLASELKDNEYIWQRNSK